MHDDTYIGGRSENNINASCMTISGGRTKQLNIFCHITSFMSDFLSFIVAERIRFFHGALQFCTSLAVAQFSDIPSIHIHSKETVTKSNTKLISRLVI